MSVDNQNIQPPRPKSRLSSAGGRRSSSGWARCRRWRAPLAQADAEQQISAGQNRVSALSGAVGADNRRLRQLDAGISGLRSKIARFQSDLDAKRAELLRLRQELNAARVRLASLKAYSAEQCTCSPSSWSPVMRPIRRTSSTWCSTANGFSNLLERLSFAQRIRTHDQQIVAAVIRARDRVAAQAVRLGGLEGRQQDIIARVLAERDQLDAAKLTLLANRCR